MTSMQSKLFGHFGIVSTTIDTIGIVETIDRIIPNEKRKISVGNAVKAMILNGMGFVSETLYLTPFFYQDKPISVLFGDDVTANDFNDDSLGRALDALWDAGLSSVFSIVAIEAMQKMDYQSTIGHLDTSSFSFHGKYEQWEEDEDYIQITHGYSKDHRPDLKQMLIGLICDHKTKIPMYFKALDGNKNDKTSFLPMIEEFQKQLSQSQMPKMIVADSALYTGKNIQSLDESMYFLSRVPNTLKAVKELHENVELEDLNIHSSDPRYHYSWHKSDFGGVEQQWLLVHSEEVAKSKEKTLGKQIKKEEASLKARLKKNAKKGFACEEDARRSLDTLMQKSKYHCIDFTEITEKKKYKGRGRPSEDSDFEMEYHIDATLLIDETCIKKEKRKHGFFVLATNRTEELDAEAIIQEYKEQNNSVERGFRYLKDPTFFVDALYIKKPSRIAAMMMVMALSLLVYSLTEYHLRKTLIEKGETLPNQLGKETNRVTLKWIFKLFQGVHLLKTVSEDGKNRQKFVLNFQPVHTKVLRLLGDEYTKCYIWDS